MAGRSTAEPNLLARALGASWVMAAVLAALLLPARPMAALSLFAGQVLAALNFFFLDRIVKLFTGAMVAPTPDRAASMRARMLLLAGAKLLLVYGGAFALTRWNGLEILPLVAGISMPFIALFLKATMLALGTGPDTSWRRARSTAGPAGTAAKLAAIFFVAATLAFASSAAFAQDHTAAGATHAESESQGGGAEHLPNWVTILNDFFPGNPVVHWLHENEYLFFAWLAGLVFFGITWLAMRKPSHVPGQLQNAIEWLVESMEDVCGGMLGKHIDRYFPFLFALFIYILTMNLLGIIPGLKSSTSTLDVTLALALITFVYVQFSGIRNLGILGYLDHLAGSPRDVVGFAMLPVMIPVHILGELVKPVSLSCRLFGNIFGEDTLIVVFVGVGALLLKASISLLALPPLMGITALFMLLQTLTSIVQALIFSLLATVYLYMMLPHEAHEHGEGAHH